MIGGLKSHTLLSGPVTDGRLRYYTGNREQGTGPWFPVPYHRRSINDCDLTMVCSSGNVWNVVKSRQSDLESAVIRPSGAHGQTVVRLEIEQQAAFAPLGQNFVVNVQENLAASAFRPGNSSGTRCRGRSARSRSARHTTDS